MTDFIADLIRTFLSLWMAGGRFAIVGTGLFGLLIGSFLSVVVTRLPTMRYRQYPENWERPPGEGADAVTVNLAVPRSRCVHCQHQLRWFENVPVLSYLILRAKCSACHGAISPLYPAIEILTCLAAICATIWFAGDLRLFGALVLSFALISIAFIDARHFIIPDDIVLPMVWLGLICNAFELFVPLKDALFGAVAGYLTLWAIFWMHRIVAGKEGMGYGDFKLAAMLGAWLGIGLVPVFLALAFAGGAIFGTAQLFIGRARITSAIPFGPFLAVAGWVSLYWGERLIETYWGLILRW